MRQILGILRRFSFPYVTVFFVILGLILLGHRIVKDPMVLIGILIIGLALMVVIITESEATTHRSKMTDYAYPGGFSERTIKYVYKGDKLVRIPFNRWVDEFDPKQSQPWAPYQHFQAMFSDFIQERAAKPDYDTATVSTTKQESQKMLVVNFDARGIITSMSNEVLEAFHCDGDMLLDKHMLDVYEIFGVNQTLWQTQIHRNKMAQSSSKITVNNQEKCFIWSYETVLDRRGEIDFILAIGHEITNLVQANGNSDETNTRDYLTGLLNQQGLYKALDRFRYSPCILTFFIDIQDFTTINNHYGHQIGDMVLKEITNELQKIAPKETIFSRFSGDKFVAVIPVDSTNHQVVEKIVEDFKKITNTSYRMNDMTLSIEKNIGYALYPEDTDKIDQLITYSSLAMRASKSKKHLSVMRYHKSMSDMLNKNFQLASNLKTALEENTIDVHFQEVINTETLAVTYIEEMARWHDETYGPISPEELFTVAKESYQLDVLERYLVKRSLLKYQQIKQMDRYKNTKISINLDPSSLLNSGFLAWLKTKVDTLSIDRSDVCIEILEATFVHNLKVCIERIKAFKEAGFKIALDDFGKEYSSLAILDHVAYDVIKLDGLFTQSIHKAETHEIIKMIRNIAQIAKKEVIVEGVETCMQSETLNELGCYLQQGFYHHRPMKM